MVLFLTDHLFVDTTSKHRLQKIAHIVTLALIAAPMWHLYADI